MTENLLQKLEEKMMTLLLELENLRNSSQQLKNENQLLKSERERFLAEKISHERKLQELISLFDAVGAVEHSVSSTGIAA